MHPDPSPEHRWLASLVGEWTFTASCSMPDESGNMTTMTSEGRETMRMLGDLWLVGESGGAMPGMPEGSPHMKAIITVGFHPHTKRFIGTWVGSPMPTMFVYEGSLDAPANADDPLKGGRVLTLDTTGPAFSPDGTPDHSQTARYQDIIELVDKNTRLLRSNMVAPDGSTTEFMRATYTRVN